MDMIVQGLPATEQRLEEIRQNQEQDEVCRLLVHYCKSGWPRKTDVTEVVNHTTWLPLNCQ